jgi:hypothetical protein
MRLGYSRRCPRRPPRRDTSLGHSNSRDSRIATSSGSFSGLLTVASQYLLAGVADLGPVRLQTAQDSQNVIGIDLHLGLAKSAHVRMASGAFLIISLPHKRSDGWWLWRQLLRARDSNGQREQYR